MSTMINYREDNNYCLVCLVVYENTTRTKISNNKKRQIDEETGMQIASYFININTKHSIIVRIS